MGIIFVSHLMRSDFGLHRNSYQTSYLKMLMVVVAVVPMVVVVVAAMVWNKELVRLNADQTMRLKKEHKTTWHRDVRDHLPQQVQCSTAKPLATLRKQRQMNVAVRLAKAAGR